MRKVDPVTKYARDVLDGRILAGKWVRLACERHLRDMKRQGTKDFPYVFDLEKAERVWDFFGELSFTVGEEDHAGQAVTLAPFELFILGSLYGWVHKKTGYRRFKKAYVQVGRKNAKSFLASGIGLFMMGFDGYRGAQVYATATHKEQAKIVWGEAVNMIRQCSDLEELLKVTESANLVEFKARNGKFRPLSKDTGKLDGFNPHCGIIDEYHEHPTNQMVKLLEDGAVQQTQALIFVITTAGFDTNPENPCVKEYNYACQVLEQVLDNEEYFPYIAQLDEDDDPWDERNWIKANPLVATLETGMNNLRRLAKEARAKEGEELRDFMTKTLNFWVDAKPAGYMPMEVWKKCLLPTEKMPSLRGRECIIGDDMSSKIDLTSISAEFPLEGGKFAVLSHSFMPADTLAKKRHTDRVPYDEWVQKGYITVTPGAVVDYRFITQWVKDRVTQEGWIVREVAYDPFFATQWATEMADSGFRTVEIRQGIPTLGTPTADFRDQAFAGNLLVEDNPVLTWAMANAVTRRNHNGNIMLDKEKSPQRIDPAAATINAHCRAIHLEPAAPDVSEFAKPEFLDKIWGLN